MSRKLRHRYRKDAGPLQHLIRQLKLHGPFATARAKAMLVAWAVSTLLIVAMIVFADLGRADAELERLGQSFLQRVSDRALVSETAIEGFAAFVASMERFDQYKARDYARILLERYPFLYMFEVAAYVPHSERAATERKLAAHYAGFYIKTFSYEADRIWEPAANADYYYPLVFQEPLLKRTDNLVGLDIHAHEHLKVAMRRSYQSGQPVATQPFDLAEGGRGYVLHRPIGGSNHISGTTRDAPAYALLALKSNLLFSNLANRPKRIHVRLLHREADSDNEVLVMMPEDSASAVERRLLPVFHYNRMLNLTSQPFVLEMEWQLGWSDLSQRTMLAVLFGSLLMFFVVKGYAEHYVRNEFVALEREGKLYELANFDTQTGLANRHHLIEFIEAAIARAHRHGHRLAVMFIDVDYFKTINDSYGHSAGDLVLSEVANRLSQELRQDEMLARYGGDEFVWVSADSKEELQLDRLIQRLKSRFDEPMEIKKHSLAVSISIGTAIYPTDGNTITALFDVADEAMYRNKRRARAGGQALSRQLENL